MRVIKSINNNVAICEDSKGRELIAFGKGIGFNKEPYQIVDLSIVDRTYYGVNPSYLDLIGEIPEKIFEITAKIVDVAVGYMDCDFNSNIVFTLADHIHFAIERNKKNMILKNPLGNDVRYFYEKEMEMGEIAVKMIQRSLKIRLPKEEAVYIALHFINAEAMSQKENEYEGNDLVIEDITRIIEDVLNIRVQKKDFNYSRFVTHMQYLLKRKDVGACISSDNIKMYEEMIREYPDIYRCVLKIKDYIIEKLHWEPNDEELLYLILHINRLYAREDCNR